MLSYKEYKLLNESLYGSFNLGLKSQNTVGGIVSNSTINGTEAAVEAEAEEAIEEAKKCNKMKKKMDSVEEVPEDEDEHHDEDHEDEDSEDEDEDEDSEDKDEDEDSEDEDEDEDSEDEDEDEDEEVSKKKPVFMKKKSKKEWSEVVSDLEDILEDVSDDDALSEIKKGLETIKEGLKKGHMKNHKKGCDCKLCKNNKKDGDEDEGLSDAQKKLPEALRNAILAKKGKKSKKDDKGEEKKCGKMMDKKCGKYMNEDEAAWWKSVNNMLGSDPAEKNWDGGWSEVGEVEQAVRENTEINEISSDLLGRAANVAQGRGDPRGMRLGDKFRHASDDRAEQEMFQKFDQSPNKVKIQSYDISIINVQQRPEGEGWILDCVGLLGRMRYPTPCKVSISNNGTSGGIKRVTLQVPGYPNEEVEGLDRRSAMVIGKLIGVRPTELPMS
jgi:hypothetical protein